MMDECFYGFTVGGKRTESILLHDSNLLRRLGEEEIGMRRIHAARLDTHNR